MNRSRPRAAVALVLAASLFGAGPLSALAWDDAPPVVDCSGTVHPPLSYGTEDAYHAAVAAQAATVCHPAPPPSTPITPPAPPSTPAAPSSPSSTSRVDVCHADDDQRTLVQSVSVRHVQPDHVKFYLASGDFLMVPGTNCGPTTP